MKHYHKLLSLLTFLLCATCAFAQSDSIIVHFTTNKQFRKAIKYYNKKVNWFIARHQPDSILALEKLTFVQDNVPMSTPMQVMSFQEEQFLNIYYGFYDIALKKMQNAQLPVLSCIFNGFVLMDNMGRKYWVSKRDSVLNNIAGSNLPHDKKVLLQLYYKSCIHDLTYQLSGTLVYNTDTLNMEATRLMHNDTLYPYNTFIRRELKRAYLKPIGGFGFCVGPDYAMFLGGLKNVLSPEVDGYMGIWASSGRIKLSLFFNGETAGMPGGLYDKLPWSSPGTINMLFAGGDVGVYFFQKWHLNIGGHAGLIKGSFNYLSQSDTASSNNSYRAEFYRPELGLMIDYFGWNVAKKMERYNKSRFNLSFSLNGTWIPLTLSNESHTSGSAFIFSFGIGFHCEFPHRDYSEW